jgi:uncharacterized protein (TIGR03067 family)
MMKARAAMLTAAGYLIVALRLLAADGTPEDAIKKEYTHFEGTWRFVSIEIEGKKVPEDGFKGSRMILKSDQFTVEEGAVTFRGTFKVDPGKKPKQIDVTFAEGPEKGKTALGIYTLEGDTYTVCIGLVGRDRPTEFVSKAASGHVLEVLKRIKP